MKIVPKNRKHTSSFSNRTILIGRSQTQTSVPEKRACFFHENFFFPFLFFFFWGKDWTLMANCGQCSYTERCWLDSSLILPTVMVSHKRPFLKEAGVYMHSIGHLSERKKGEQATGKPKPWEDRAAKTIRICGEIHKLLQPTAGVGAYRVAFPPPVYASLLQYTKNSRPNQS